MALGETRRSMRLAAITTVAEYARSMGEEGSDHDDHGMTEEEFVLYVEECKKVANKLDKMAEKLRV